MTLDCVWRTARSFIYRLWSAEIMAEVRRTLSYKFGIAPNRIAHLESKLCEHFPEAWMEGFEPLISSMTNDAKDRHVLAAAAHLGISENTAQPGRRFTATCSTLE